MKKNIFFFFFTFFFCLFLKVFGYEFCEFFFNVISLPCGARSLARSFVCPRSALCETSGIEE